MNTARGLTVSTRGLCRYTRLSRASTGPLVRARPSASIAYTNAAQGTPTVGKIVNHLRERETTCAARDCRSPGRCVVIAAECLPLSAKILMLRRSCYWEIRSRGRLVKSLCMTWCEPRTFVQKNFRRHSRQAYIIIVFFLNSFIFGISMKIHQIEGETYA